MKRKLNEWLSVQHARHPERLVLGGILLFNIVFFLIASVVISRMSLTGTEHMDLFQAAFCTITMILDAGCIQFVVADIGTAGVAVSLICLIIVLIGMVSFTGAVIGYITNTISSFVDNANASGHRLRLTGHTVILNWNNRASEIVNDLLYASSRQKVVVLAMSRKAEIEKEIEERIADTIRRENEALLLKYRDMSRLSRSLRMLRTRFRSNLSVLVREGDVFSSQQLHAVSLEHARSVVILGNDRQTISRQLNQSVETLGSGNALIIKTLMQVADITAADYSEDGQKIVVEVEDDWTWDLVQKIILAKQVDGKCNIVPVRVNQILGQLLSQFALMPELNWVYRELFSNKGAAFYSREQKLEEEVDYARRYLSGHRHAIPLTFMENRGKTFGYYTADEEFDIYRKTDVRPSGFRVSLNRDYWIEQKSVIILGHNSKCRDIMKGFASFCAEWGRRDESIVKITVIDDEASLAAQDHYRAWPFVSETVAADLFDRKRICGTIERVLAAHPGDTSIMILSDDTAVNGAIDANAFTNLIYVQDIINRHVRENPDFDTDSIDVIVEILDPKHYDVVNNYSVNNVVISNRFISKMITQIGEKEALFDFYTDILTYDEETEEGESFESKEVYIKQVSQFFSSIPARCTAAELIRAVFEASVDESLPPEKRYPTITLGYCKPGGRIVLFSGDQDSIPVELDRRDKLVVFSNH
ncbi:MAG: hypothetical protein IJH78_03255 [Clostridia bacterium]|nr:hypothetical protein [Clostridia bacterium]